ncbi:cell envelope integrity protein TolA [Acidiferrobacter thiooxydans]|uniref:cell envelope integrity protein TolA n=1 Tax=Acidiferrobacter thiooxydans TaxID=163359 RepID=UPI001E4C2400|nr:cell envelope integrity protein TolA [Acidiferrobacter thiooxydans]UEO00412.1 cell envelope integrity protein TolA [Acidiferrobacter thiooxydans]
MAGRTREAPGRTRAVVYALLVHLAVIAFLVVSFRWSELDTSYVVKTGPHVIHAFMVGPRPVPRPTPPIPQPRVAPPAPRPAVRKGPSKTQLARQKALQKAHAKAQALARAKAEALARAKAEALARAKAQAQAQAQALARAKAEALAKIKARAEALARARAEQAARAAARKRLQAQEQAAAARARAKLQREVAQAAARARQRAAARAAAARAAAAAARGVVSRYKALIEARVSAAWVAVPQSKGLHCIVRVRLIAGGQVVSARIVQSSGNSVFDRSVIAAIYNAAPLPVPHSATKLQYLNPLTFVFTAPKGSSP